MNKSIHFTKEMLYYEHFDVVLGGEPAGVLV